jgi:hypothetical protein
VWLSKFASFVWSHLQDLWILRNTYLHGSSNFFSRGEKSEIKSTTLPNIQTTSKISYHQPKQRTQRPSPTLYITQSDKVQKEQ